MSKREQLEKNVVDTKAGFDAAFVVSAAANAAYAAWSKSKRELNNYLKEKDV